MYHWIIGLGLMIGLGSFGAAGWDGIGFLCRLVGTCAVLYGFFLSGMLGAGDIKLMAVCVGILGVWRGVWMIFCSMVLALLAAMIKGKVWKNGWLMIRGMELRLAPFLFAGYGCLLLSLQAGEWLGRRFG